MSVKKIIFTEKAPKPIGPYSQGVCASSFLFISGQIPIDPVTGQLIEGDFTTKVRRVLDNLKNIVEAAGGSLKNIIKVNVYLRDIGKFSEFNSVYSEYFLEDPPARSVVEVSNLPRGVDLEVEAIAFIP
ncbi:MAG: RidA family protein [Thermoprotei archaeon]|jgi:2-iminobutanoate/2-iminopropanoate deaminase